MKWATEGHVTGSDHVKRAQEYHGLDTLLDKKEDRVLYAGYELDMTKNYLTRVGLRSFWGNIDAMPMRAFTAIIRAGGVWLRNGKTEHWVPAAKIKGVTPGVVAYRGDGKYAKQGSQFMYYQNIPEDISYEPDGSMSSLSDLQLQVIGHGQSWWPVVALQLDPETIMIVGSDGGVYIVCIYQCLGCRVEAWWIEISRWAA